MAEHPKAGGWGKLIAVKLVCCGGLLLFATGYLTVGGIAAWLNDGVAMALGLTVLAVAVLVLRRRQASGKAASDDRPGLVDTDQAE